MSISSLIQIASELATVAICIATIWTSRSAAKMAKESINVTIETRLFDMAKNLSDNLLREDSMSRDINSFYTRLVTFDQMVNFHTNQDSSILMAKTSLWALLTPAYWDEICKGERIKAEISREEETLSATPESEIEHRAAREKRIGVLQSHRAHVFNSFGDVADKFNMEAIK